MKNAIAAFIVFMSYNGSAYSVDKQSVDMQVHYEYEKKVIERIEEKILSQNHCDVVFVYDDNLMVLNWVKYNSIGNIYYPDHINKIKDIAINKKYIIVKLDDIISDDANQRVRLVKNVSVQALEQDEQCGVDLIS